MIGGSKGRSIRAIKDRVDELAGAKETRSMGVLLSGYHTKCEVAKAWRGGRGIMTMSQKDLESGLALFAKEEVTLPADVSEALVVRYCTEALTEKMDLLCSCYVPICNV